MTEVWKVEPLRLHVLHLLSEAVESPALESDLLIAEARAVEREELWRHAGEVVEEEQVQWVLGRVRRRLMGEPLAYLLGHWDFYGRRFAVGPGALVPRPETEHLVEEVLRREPRGWLAEVGVGSGALAVTVLAERVGEALRVVGTDCSVRALAWASENAARHRVRSRLALVRGDLLAGLRQGLAAVVCNPPYVESRDYHRLPRDVRDHEPPEALVPVGESPRALRQRLVAQAWERLEAGGFLALEVGAGQAGEARDELLASGFRQVVIRNDWAGIGRVVAGVRVES